MIVGDNRSNGIALHRRVTGIKDTPPLLGSAADDL
jgi:hypothetical protein